MDAVAFLQLDLPPLLAALLAGGTCGLLGSFLVLRRESLVGDALSHAVLPGIVLGFALTGLRAGLPMLAGALVGGAAGGGALIGAGAPRGAAGARGGDRRGLHHLLRHRPAWCSR